MSSPNHHTSNIEDAFSFNFPDYIPASSDYVLASPGKTYSSSSNNSFGLVPIASPTLLLFHDDPYMKVMHAYYAKESPIPPPVIMPPSPMLSPIFNPQEFFLPEELLPPKKRGHRMPPKRNSASAASASDAPAINQAAIRNLKPREAHVARKCRYKEFISCQPFNFKGSEGVVGLIRWFERTESVFSSRKCTEDCKVKFVAAYKLSWVEFKKLLIKKYYPRTKVQKIEDKFYYLTVKGNDLKTYVRRFQELATLCPIMMSDYEKMMEAFIGDYLEETVRSYAATIAENSVYIGNRLLFKLGSFDIAVGMDWLSKYHAKIICDEKVIHIPIDGETLIIQGDQTQVMEKKSEDKRLENTPVVKEFLDVFPEDLPGLPPVRQVEFQIDLIPRAHLLKVSPRKGVIQFGKQGKLNPRYIRPFKILERIGPVAYKLELPEELTNFHSTLYVSNLKKYLSDESLVIPMKELRLDDKLNFVEEPMEVMDREVKKLKQSRIPIVKVRWNPKRGPEFTWEREDQIRA
nr:putative reverse transcriptase domain-containing protein [Tanacetum cinerariifolium]